MPLLTLTDVSLAYGLHPLLAHTDFQIKPGDREKGAELTLLIPEEITTFR